MMTILLILFILIFLAVVVFIWGDSVTQKDKLDHEFRIKTTEANYNLEQEKIKIQKDQVERNYQLEQSRLKLEQERIELERIKIHNELTSSREKNTNDLISLREKNSNDIILQNMKNDTELKVELLKQLKNPLIGGKYKELLVERITKNKVEIYLADQEKNMNHIKNDNG